jgi:glycerophosphoryl diester phosphodiesterase
MWYTNVPLIIAHRGASMFAPENTIAAFQLAAELGADAIELDAKLSSDGHVIIHHDLTVDRTTNGTGRVCKHSLRELKCLDAGSHFNSTFAGERIPSLLEVFELFGDKVLINVEMTNYAHPHNRLPQKIVRLVRDYNLEKRVLLSSFNPIALYKARRLAPEIMMGLLVGKHESKMMRRFLISVTPHDAFHPQNDVLDSATILMMHARGRLIFVWTVNDEERLHLLFQQGVDGVFTDHPSLAIKSLAEVMSSPENVTPEL